MEHGQSTSPQVRSNPFDDSIYVIKDESAKRPIPTTSLEVEDNNRQTGHRLKGSVIFCLRLKSKKKWLLSLVCITMILLIVIVLAVEKTQKRDRLSTAMKQTGLAPVYLGNESITLALFYQNEEGDLRYDHLQEGGSWEQGSTLGV